MQTFIKYTLLSNVIRISTSRKIFKKPQSLKKEARVYISNACCNCNLNIIYLRDKSVFIDSNMYQTLLFLYL